jgi:hypothetical protein
MLFLPPLEFRIGAVGCTFGSGFRDVGPRVSTRSAFRVEGMVLVMVVMACSSGAAAAESFLLHFGRWVVRLCEVGGKLCLFSNRSLSDNRRGVPL